MPRASDVIRAVDRAAPFALQEPWDNSGLQLGDPRARVQRVLVALDPSLAAAREAKRRRAGIVVTHHPLFFEPVQQLSPASPVGAVALELAAAKIALVSAHTNYDAAAGGLNDLLARRLGLRDTAPLEPAPPGRGYKLVVFVPEDDLERVRRALFDAGAGRIGDYSQCSFSARGTGTFLGGATTHPAVGRRGRREEAAELRLETVVPPECVDAAVRALRAAHSYEEPAFDLYPLDVPREGAGLGRAGDLAKAATLGEVVARVKRSLGVRTLEVVGRLPGRAKVRRAAVVGGSGGSHWRSALAAGAQVLVTGEMKHSDRVASAAAGLVTLVAGHWATERPAVAGLAKIIATALPEVTVHQSAAETNPTSWR